jgi:diguanylate cyclase (GGDEF)-like protein
MEEYGKLLAGSIRRGVSLPYLLLLLLYIVYQIVTYPHLKAVEWYSVLSEGFVASLLLVALVLVEKLHTYRRAYWPMLIGFGSLLFSTVTDVLDEFLQQPTAITIVGEDMLQLVGMMAIVIGLYQWSNLNRHLQQRLRQQAITDYLTGCLNRRGFMTSIEHEAKIAARYHNPLTLIWFDLDRFKLINDQYGHYAGDELLRDIARLTRQRLRDADIFARMGGEEFCILMSETPLAGALEVAEKLRAAFANREGSEIEVTASFGVGELYDGETPEHFLNRVDGALYRAKEKGRNRIEAE